MFNLDSRESLIPVGFWVPKAHDRAWRARSNRIPRNKACHVVWDMDLANAPEDVIYPMPHLIYSHDTGVVGFRVDEACTAANVSRRTWSTRTATAAQKKRAAQGERSADTIRGGGRAGGRDDGARHTDGTSECATGGEGEGKVASGGGNTATRPRMRATGAVRLRTETPTKTPTPQPAVAL